MAEPLTPLRGDRVQMRAQGTIAQLTRRRVIHLTSRLGLDRYLTANACMLTLKGRRKKTSAGYHIVGMDYMLLNQK